MDTGNYKWKILETKAAGHKYGFFIPVKKNKKSIIDDWMRKVPHKTLLRGDKREGMGRAEAYFFYPAIHNKLQLGNAIPDLNF